MLSPHISTEVKEHSDFFFNLELIRDSVVRGNDIHIDLLKSIFCHELQLQAINIYLESIDLQLPEYESEEIEEIKQDRNVPEESYKIQIFHAEPLLTIFLSRWVFFRIDHLVEAFPHALGYQYIVNMISSVCNSSLNIVMATGEVIRNGAVSYSRLQELVPKGLSCFDLNIYELLSPQRLQECCQYVLNFTSGINKITRRYKKYGVFLVKLWIFMAREMEETLGPVDLRDVTLEFQIRNQLGIFRKEWENLCWLQFLFCR